jgi:hypothetical protein
VKGFVAFARLNRHVGLVEEGVHGLADVEGRLGESPCAHLNLVSSHLRHLLRLLPLLPLPLLRHCRVRQE